MIRDSSEIGLEREYDMMVGRCEDAIDMGACVQTRNSLHSRGAHAVRLRKPVNCWVLLC